MLTPPLPLHHPHTHTRVVGTHLHLRDETASDARSMLGSSFASGTSFLGGQRSEGPASANSSAMDMSANVSLV